VNRWLLAAVGTMAVVAAWTLFDGIVAPVGDEVTRPAASPGPRAGAGIPPSVEPTKSEDRPRAVVPPRADEPGRDDEFAEPPDDVAEPAPPEEGIVAPPSVTGTTVWPLNRSGLVGAVREAMPTLQACYDEALEVVPDLEGGLETKLRIEERNGIGQVAAVVIESEVDDLPLEGCMLEALEGLQFDPPEGTMFVRFPFEFRVEEP